MERAGEDAADKSGLTVSVGDGTSLTMPEILTTAEGVADAGGGEVAREYLLVSVVGVVAGALKVGATTAWLFGFEEVPNEIDGPSLAKTGGGGGAAGAPTTGEMGSGFGLAAMGEGEEVEADLPAAACFFLARISAREGPLAGAKPVRLDTTEGAGVTFANEEAGGAEERLSVGSVAPCTWSAFVLDAVDGADTGSGVEVIAEAEALPSTD